MELRGDTHMQNNLLNQRLVAVCRDGTPEEHSGKDRHRRRHPHLGALHLDIQFIGLHLTQLDATLTDHLFLNLLGVLSHLGLPLGDGAFINAKSEHNRLGWTSGGKQSQDEGHDPSRVFETIERCPGCFSERLVTGMADVTPLFIRMNTGCASFFWMTETSPQRIDNE